MYVIEYRPVEDPVVVAEFDQKEEAEAHMEVIRKERPRSNIIPINKLKKITRYNTWVTKGREIDFNESWNNI